MKIFLVFTSFAIVAAISMLRLEAKGGTKGSLTSLSRSSSSSSGKSPASSRKTTDQETQSIGSPHLNASHPGHSNYDLEDSSNAKKHGDNETKADPHGHTAGHGQRTKTPTGNTGTLAMFCSEQKNHHTQNNTGTHKQKDTDVHAPGPAAGHAQDPKVPWTIAGLGNGHNNTKVEPQGHIRIKTPTAVEHVNHHAHNTTRNHNHTTVGNAPVHGQDPKAPWTNTGTGIGHNNTKVDPQGHTNMHGQRVKTPSGNTGTLATFSGEQVNHHLHNTTRNHNHTDIKQSSH